MRGGTGVVNELARVEASITCLYAVDLEDYAFRLSGLEDV